MLNQYEIKRSLEEKIKSEEMMMIDVREYLLREREKKNLEEMKRKRDLEKTPWRNKYGNRS